MFKTPLCASVLALTTTLLLSSPAEAATTKRVTVSSLNVRSGPSARYPSVGRLVRDQRVVVHRTQAGWAQIDFQGRRRWTSARYLAAGASRATTSRPATTRTVPRTASGATRTASRTQSVGNKSLGASVTRAGQVRSGSAAESFALRGTVLGASSGVASGEVTIGAQAGGDVVVKRRKIELLGREVTLSGGVFARELLWLDDVLLWRGAVGPVPLAFKIDSGVRAELSLTYRRKKTVVLAGSASLFGAGKVEVDVLIARAGVRATLRLIEVSMPATFSFSPGETRGSLEFVVSSNVRVGLYASVGRKIFGVGFEKEFSLEIPFLQFTLREVRIPILSGSVKTG